MAIVAALASDVELLVLDEPTSGLDPLMEVVFKEEVAAEKARGRTVLLSSHILSEAEALADRVTIIREGRAVETGTLDALRRHTRTTVTAVLADPPESTATLRAIHDARLEGGRLTGAIERSELNAAMASLARYGITALTVSPPSLEDLFLRHYDADRPRHAARHRVEGDRVEGDRVEAPDPRGGAAGAGARHRREADPGGARGEAR